jgi:hypothetical protein
MLRPDATGSSASACLMASARRAATSAWSTREDLVQEDHDLLRRESFRSGSEARDVGEEDGDFLAALRDDTLRDLQPLGDGAREDAEKQGLRPLLLRGQKPVRTVAGADEVLEKRERRHGRAENVQREVRHDDRGRNLLRGLREDAVDGRGESDQGEEASERGDRLAGTVDHERAEGRGERPERDGARFHEPPEAPLKEKGENEDHCDLARAIGGVALRPGEESQPEQ